MSVDANKLATEQLTMIRNLTYCLLDLFRRPSLYRRLDRITRPAGVFAAGYRDVIDPRD